MGAKKVKRHFFFLKDDSGIDILFVNIFENDGEVGDLSYYSLGTTYRKKIVMMILIHQHCIRENCLF